MRETGCAYRPRMLATFHCGRVLMLKRMDSLFLSLESSENKGHQKTRDQRRRKSKNQT